MKKLKLKFKILYLLVPGILFFSAASALAAQLSLDVPKTQIQIGQRFEVKLFLDSEQASINALEGKIIYPNNILDLEEIRDGGSIVNLWIDNPRMVSGQTTQSNEIKFSGIVPGGYNEKQGLIFAMIFKAKATGEGEFEVRDSKTLLNDGQGTPAVLKTLNQSFVVVNEPGGDNFWVPPTDVEQPESFVPEIVKDRMLFEGKWVIVFVTQDKISGIDHYEVKEARQWIRLGNLVSFFKDISFYPWVRAESPYVLTDQELRSFIWVKAVDRAGNERVVKIAPRYPLIWYENYENWIIIIIIIIPVCIILFMVRRFLRKKSNE